MGQHSYKKENLVVMTKEVEKNNEQSIAVFKVTMGLSWAW
jgi:hypothetical protein